MIKYSEKHGRKLIGENNFPVIYWTKHEPKDVEIEGYFQNVSNDFGAPKDRAWHFRGMSFIVVCEAQNGFMRAEFVFDGYRQITLSPATMENQAQYQFVPVVSRNSDWVAHMIKPLEEKAVEVPREEYVKSDNTEIKWNPGKKVHEVFEDGEVVFSSADKQEANDVMLGAKPKTA